MKRLDETEFTEIVSIYKNMTNKLLSEKEFEESRKTYENKYLKFINYVDKGHKIKGGTMGRGETKYARNIVYGWFLENIISKVILKNPKVKEIEFFGDDNAHDFFINDDSKIEIIGPKTTEPDFLIKFKNGGKMLMELKSAAKEIFTIKKGNIEQLSKAAAFNQIPTSIIMIDLENSTYEIKNLEYFIDSRPFINQSMEGQLCFDFPRPTNPIYNLVKIDISTYINTDIFELDIVKKYMLLAKVENNKLKSYIKIIKNKMRLEKLNEEFSFLETDFEEKIKTIKERCPEVNKSWEELGEEISEVITKNKK